MNEFDAILAIGAITVLLLGVVSGYVRNRLWISEPAICLGVGLALSNGRLIALERVRERTTELAEDRA